MRSSRGFTLIEVLLTVIILSGCLVPMIGGLIANATAAKTAEQYLKAIYASQGNMFEILNRPPQALSAKEGQISDYHYQLTIEPAEIQRHLKEARLKVSWLVYGKEKSITLVTYLWDLPQKGETP